MNAKKKRKKENAVILEFVIIFAIIITSIIILTKVFPTYTELNEGLPTFDFCKDKCNGTSGLTTSNNNSKYNFIRCECALELIKGASVKYSIILISNYFDSLTYQKISETEAIKRIEEGK